MFTIQWICCSNQGRHKNYRHLNKALCNQPSKYQAINRKLKPRAMIRWKLYIMCNLTGEGGGGRDHDDVQQPLDGSTEAECLYWEDWGGTIWAGGGGGWDQSEICFWSTETQIVSAAPGYQMVDLPFVGRCVPIRDKFHWAQASV